MKIKLDSGLKRRLLAALAASEIDTDRFPELGRMDKDFMYFLMKVNQVEEPKTSRIDYSKLSTATLLDLKNARTQDDNDE